jgi:hypothetical protein
MRKINEKRGIILTAIVAITFAIIFILVDNAMASSQGLVKDGRCSVAQAKRDVAKAKREYRKAAKKLREAKHVLKATRQISSIHGASVGRWVRLARRVGWSWIRFGTLFAIIDRESSGQPAVPNAQGSGALGLLQFMPGWYHGQWGYPAFNATSPKQSLKAGLWVYRHQGWWPWYPVPQAIWKKSW